jgi:molybdopterin synthase sulfur carrier subunit
MIGDGLPMREKGRTMEVSFYATLRQVVGAKSAHFDLPERATVRQLLNEILRRYPLLEREILDESGNLYQHVHLFVNGRDASFLENGLDSELPADAKIGLFPAVGGGSTALRRWVEAG